jgi:uncharacterized phage protein (TIGR02220 family)
MPLDTVRLLDSDLVALSTGEEFKAAVLLWCKAWQQVPASSLPDDDRILASLSGAGARWKRIREVALRGFEKCADGRLYHPVIAEKAIEAWAFRKAQRTRAGKRWHRGGSAGAHATAHATGDATAYAEGDATAMQGTVTGQEKEQPLSGGAPDGVRSPEENAKAQERREARAAGERAIAYLNAKAGTHYKLTTESSLKFAVDRILIDGATEADLTAVVDFNLARFQAGKLERLYLRPETLWNKTKFAGYIGQVGATKPLAGEKSPTATVYAESADAKRTKLAEYPAAAADDLARKALATYGNVPWMRGTQYLVVDGGAGVSKFSVAELRG